MDDRVNQKFMLSVLAEAGRSDESKVRKASQENHISACLSSYWRKNTDIHELAIENIPFIVDLPIQNGDFLQQAVRLPEGNEFLQQFHFLAISAPEAFTWPTFGTQEVRQQFRRQAQDVFNGWGG